MQKLIETMPWWCIKGDPTKCVTFLGRQAVYVKLWAGNEGSVVVIVSFCDLCSTDLLSYMHVISLSSREFNVKYTMFTVSRQENTWEAVMTRHGCWDPKPTWLSWIILSILSVFSIISTVSVFSFANLFDTQMLCDCCINMCDLLWHQSNNDSFFIRNPCESFILSCS